MEQLRITGDDYMYYAKFKSSFCKMIIVGDECGVNVLHLDSDEGKRSFKIKSSWIENKEFFKKEIMQLNEFLNGERKEFSIKINPEGTIFQKKVWNALKNISYGETCSYKDIAINIGNENSSRAVGMANSKNPIPLIIPCHRVIGKNGKLTGFAFGISIKKKLLELESKITI